MSGRVIQVHHVTRVEGHGDIHIEIRKGKLVEARWDVIEAPRFFEAILVGKQWDNAAPLTSRICGICSISHALASIRAVEDAFGIEPSVQTQRLRLLLKHSETLASHALHLYFLAAPDFFSVGSVLALARSHPDIVERAVRLKALGNDLCDAIAGRRLHPVRTVVGGFTMFPDKEELNQFRDRLENALDDLQAAVDLLDSLTLPDFTRKTEYVSLQGTDRYPFIGGALMSSEGVVREERAYLEMTNEYMVEHSTSKWSRLTLESFAVGPLARTSNNFNLLHPQARMVASVLGITPPCYMPFLSHVARVTECIHVVHDSIQLIDQILDNPWDAPRMDVVPRAGVGVGAVEAPRGILYHCYELDESGRIVRADCVIPTSQNHANIHHDLVELARRLAVMGKDDAEIQKLAEMLVRAYDPCISCSVH